MPDRMPKILTATLFGPEHITEIEAMKFNITEIEAMKFNSTEIEAMKFNSVVKKKATWRNSKKSLRKLMFISIMF